MISRIALAVIMSAALGACTTQGSMQSLANGSVPVSTASLEATASATTPAAPRRSAFVPGERPLVRLPAAAGAIVAIRGNRFADGFHQTVEFGRAVAGLKPNTIDLRLRARARGHALEGLDVEPPTQGMIRDELASQFPTMEMRIVDRPRRNVAGIYGLAVGRWANGARCLYAWQWIDAPGSIEASSEHDAVALRIRICGTDVSLDGLAALIDDLQVSPASVEVAPLALVAAPTTVKARRPKSAAPIGAPQPAATVVARHRAWDAIALNRPPIVPASEPVADTSRAVLDPTLPQAAFRGPATAATAIQSHDRR